MEQNVLGDMLGKRLDLMGSSFTNMLTTKLDNIVDDYGASTILFDGVKYTLKASNVKVYKEGPTAKECIQFDLTYSALVACDMKLTKEDGTILFHDSNFFLTLFPLPTTMELHPGLFIIRGKPYIVPTTKTLAHDLPFCFKNQEVAMVQVRSRHLDKPFRSTSTLEIVTFLKRKRDYIGSEVVVRIPFQKKALNVAVIAKALGVFDIPTFLQMVKTCAGDLYDANLFLPFEIAMRNHTNRPDTKEEAILQVSKQNGKTTLSSGEHTLRNEVFPHIRQKDEEATQVHKLNFLAMCTSLCILTKINKIEPDDRDCISNVMLVPTADHLGSLFRMKFTKHIGNVAKQLRRSMTMGHNIDISKIFGASRLSSQISTAISNGCWSIKRKGMSMLVDASNLEAILTQIRRISSSVTQTSGAHTEPREGKESQFGMICVAASPEGEQCGLVGEIASTAFMSDTPENDQTVLIQILEKELGEFLEPFGTTGVVFTNSLGASTHCVSDVTGLVKKFRQLRRDCEISPTAEIAYSKNNIRIFDEEGRIYRPLGVAKAGNHEEVNPFDSDPMATMLGRGQIEFIGTSEQKTLCRIALKANKQDHPEATNYEITDIASVGLMAATVPFYTSQQAPRLPYFLCQKKQIIAGDNQLLNYNMSCKSTLDYSMRSLTTTMTQEAVPQLQNMCAGTPAVVAFIMSKHTQEDAIMLNKSSVEFGMFAASSARRYSSQCVNTASTTNDDFGGLGKDKDGVRTTITERFEKPGHNTSRQVADDTAIEECGLPKRRANIASRGIVIGKTKIIRRFGHKALSSLKKAITKRRDISLTCRHDEAGMVLSVHLIHKPSGTVAVVDVRTERKIEIGDKLSTNKSQKGVVSKIMSREDMPFSMDSGMAPDVVVSTIGLPSRMTIGSIMEALTGKAAAMTGDLTLGIDDQNFDEQNHVRSDRLRDVFAKYGFACNGTETYIDGTTGKVMAGVRVMTGIISYYRLNHLAAKKEHARALGPNDTTSRQPKDGRKSQGGLRTGELEVLCTSAFGAAKVLQAALRDQSDAFEINVCETCGFYAVAHETLGIHFCKHCNSTENISRVPIPYSLHLIIEEMRANGIDMKLQLGDE